MSNIGIFFGSDTGNTEKVAKMIRKNISFHKTQLFDIANTSKNQMESFDFLIFGIPTWYYGELQCDWDDFLPILNTINFKNKQVAIFGCGDQEDYSEYFCDAMYTIYKIVKKNQATIIGQWPTKGYFFQQSKSLINKNYFVGLVIDEDRQKEQTEKRVATWVKNILKK